MQTFWRRLLLVPLSAFYIQDMEYMENEKHISKPLNIFQIPYIGTEILNFHCFATKMLFSFCKSIIPEDFKSAGPHLSFPGVKTRFKAFLQNIPKKGPCGST